MQIVKLSAIINITKYFQIEVKRCHGQVIILVTNNITISLNRRNRLHLTGQTLNVARQNRNVKTFQLPQLTTHNRVSGFQVRSVCHSLIVQQYGTVQRSPSHFHMNSAQVSLNDRGIS